MKDPYIVIPSLNPRGQLKELVANLKQEGFCDIFIVNDGSRADCDSILFLVSFQIQKMWIFKDKVR